MSDLSITAYKLSLENKAAINAIEKTLASGQMPSPTEWGRLVRTIKRLNEESQNSQQMVSILSAEIDSVRQYVRDALEELKRGHAAQDKALAVQNKALDMLEKHLSAPTINNQITSTQEVKESPMSEGSSGGGNTFNQNVSGGEGVQANQVAGEANITQENTFGDKSAEVEKLLNALEAGLKEDAADAADDWQPPMDDLRRMAMTSPPAAPEEGLDPSPEYVAYEEEKATVLERLTPYASTFGRVLGTFSAEALSTVASGNPFIAGAIAVAKDFRNN